MQHRIHDTFLQGNNTSYMIFMYEKYCADKNSVPKDWQDYFHDLGDKAHEMFGDDRSPNWVLSAKPIKITEPQIIQTQVHLTKEIVGVHEFIRAYRSYGHMLAKTDPLGLEEKKHHPFLKLESHGITEHLLDQEIASAFGKDKTTPRQLEKSLSDIYCGTIGFEYNHINNIDQVQWLQQRIESTLPHERVSREDKKHILKTLWSAEAFEHFLHVKYPSIKRFGLEGGESLIPGLEALVHQAVHHGVKRIHFGMAHRGRLGVAANILHKPLEQILAEFQTNHETSSEGMGSGDVKYHLGYSSQRDVNKKSVRLSLTPNPSHLEIINPIIVGKVRAQQALLDDTHAKQVMAVLLHGDAAFIGQGSVAETFQLSGLPGYTTGGTVHIIINNQVGFTTSPKYAKTSHYCSDIAKIVDAPIFHVNGDDPEAVTWAMRLAMDYRHHFGKDVVIDLVCYRRYGHNEIDEPSFTQPLLYKTIAKHPSAYVQYRKKLIDHKVITEKEVEQIEKEYHHKLQEAFELITTATAPIEKRDVLKQLLGDFWSGIKASHMLDQPMEYVPITGVPHRTLKEIGAASVRVPKDFNLHQRLSRVLTPRQQMFETGENIDWGAAESLAFGSLLLEKIPVRLSGQDVGRGTFSHRHIVWVDQDTEQKYVSLNHIKAEQALCEVIDSPLSEMAVMGFEYGYSAANPNALVIWEAQFGDFSNGAQVIIDQFLAAGEHKWQRLNGLTLLLPHGYEGQGPEHSSCRLERYLQLCAENNMYVANCSTPANYFHILRRQIISETRKPLVLVTPKSLLRHKNAVSALKDIDEGTCFMTVLEDPLHEHKHIKRVVLCSGKVYYELLQQREELGLQKEIALIRLEQYYPFPHDRLAHVLKPYAHATFVWCQEEPKNMGAWSFLDRRLEEVLHEIQATHPVMHYAGRPEAASPATGKHHYHEKEQALLVSNALTALEHKRSKVRG